MIKRVAMVLVALIGLSSYGYAQQSTLEKPAAERANKVATPPSQSTSVVGLTKAQVQARLGKPSLALSTVWTYNQPQGTLHVHFKNGVVSELKRDAPAAVVTPTGKGYTNVDGKHIQSPRKADVPPAGASAQCRDGSYSFSAHRSGTCSHHGGVSRWL